MSKGALIGKILLGLVIVILAVLLFYIRFLIVTDVTYENHIETEIIGSLLINNTNI